MKVGTVRKTGWQWVRPWRWFWQTFGWNRGSHNWNYRHLNVAIVHRVTARSSGIECEVCNRSFHAKCQQISNTEYDSMENQFWMCSFCRKNDQTDIKHSSETEVFLRYVDDTVRTVRGDTKELLDAVNNLHPNLQITLETTDDKKQFAISRHVNQRTTGGEHFLHMVSKTIRYWNNSEVLYLCTTTT